MKPKKSLGQNFLKSPAIVARIAKAGDIKEGEVVLEIGPGKGILTRAILALGAKVIAVEKDNELISFLNEKFSSEIATGILKIIHGDILEFSAEEILKSVGNFSQLRSPKSSDVIFEVQKSYKICANIPYYITGEVIRKFLEEKNPPTNMTLLLQKEVAKRIVASDKKESILSLSVKIYGEPKYIETVKKNMFTPAPTVDSAILNIANISKRKFEESQISPERFFEVVRAGFAHKRKKLSGNLKEVVEKNILEKFKNERAEDLTLADWIELAK